MSCTQYKQLLIIVLCGKTAEHSCLHSRTIQLNIYMESGKLEARSVELFSKPQLLKLRFLFKTAIT